MAETYGYIRVSSTDQNESRQRIALEQQGISSGHIFMDKMSGRIFSARSIRHFPARRPDGKSAPMDRIFLFG